MSILVVPDTHCHPGESLKRFEWLNKCIRDWTPEKLVLMGDWWDMPSLCLHDSKNADFSMRNIKKDLNIGLHALDIVMANTNIATYMLGGNHDDGRIAKVLAQDARLEGLLTTPKELISRHYGDDIKWIPFQSVLKLDGICFSHWFPSGVMNKPIGGEHPAATLLKKTHTSCVAGHQHVYDYAERTKADGSRLCALMSGCFIDPNYRPFYAGSTRNMWRLGVTLLHEVKSGSFDIEFISIERLKRIYE